MHWIVPDHNEKNIYADAKNHLAQAQALIYEVESLDG